MRPTEARRQDEANSAAGRCFGGHGLGIGARGRDLLGLIQDLYAVHNGSRLNSDNVPQTLRKAAEGSQYASAQR